jgi:hypothetical protein
MGRAENTSLVDVLYINVLYINVPGERIETPGGNYYLPTFTSI